MQNTLNDLAASVRTAVCEKLLSQLATLLDLKLHAKQAHWNVKGPVFYALHELFDKVADEADGYADEIAERIVQLGGTAEGLAKSISSRSVLPEFPPGLFDGEAVLGAMAKSLAAATKSARSAIEQMDQLGDKNAADMMTEISSGLDKALWMVEAHLYRK